MILVLASGAAWAADDALIAHEPEGKAKVAIPHFDEATGKFAAFYPPHPVVDYKHMLLDITIPDMNKPRATAIQTLTLASISGSTAELTLDAKALKINTVMVEGRAVEFKHDGKHLTISFAPPLEQGRDVKVITSYEIDDPPLGFVWTPESPAWPGRPAQLHSQGEPETNSYWFPCHDFPNEKLTTELLVTAPADFVVSSNGRLLDHGSAILPVDSDGTRSLRPYESWHFLQDKPHVNYLVSLVVGKFDVVDIGTKALPMPVYVPPGRGGDVKSTYGHTPAMIAHFEKVLGVKYPWDKYGQVIVWNFGAGGMENTSVTTLYDTAIVEKNTHDFDLDGLISHELGHQWFGDLLTCNSWEHIWLNEGFATYMTALWMEKRDGLPAYQEYIRGTMDGIINADKPEAPTPVGMVSKVYTHPWETFRRPANPYGKGCSILAMLRAKLGDDLFFKGIHNYVDKFKFKTVETSDLRYELEAVSGQSLEQFFTQWCMRPGTPKVSVKPAWDESTKTLTVHVEQTQAINGDNPAYEFDLPLYIQTSTDPKSARRETIAVNGKSVSASFTLDSAPTMFAVDPDQSVMADYTIDRSIEQSLNQLSAGPTPAAKVQAMRSLGKDSTSQTAEALRRVVTDKGQYKWLRIEAVKALEARKADTDLRSLATAVADNWEVREALMGALVVVGKNEKGEPTSAAEGLARTLADRATRDSSVKVRAAAIKALGKLKAQEHKAIILDALRTPSQSDVLRQAALDALVDLDAADTLPIVIEYTKAGNDSRTRPNAVGAVAKLAHHDPKLAYATLVELLSDRELRTSRAAGEGLVAMNDPKAIEVIEKLVKQTRAEEAAWQGGQWLKTLRNAQPAAAGK